jgi:hypothetical protein
VYEIRDLSVSSKDAADGKGQYVLKICRQYQVIANEIKVLKKIQRKLPSDDPKDIYVSRLIDFGCVQIDNVDSQDGKEMAHDRSGNS